MLLICILFLFIPCILCKDLLEIASNQGYLSRTTAKVGTQIDFDGPLRINKDVSNLTIDIEFENRKDDQIFGIFPSKNVSVGRKFGIFVEDPSLLPKKDGSIILKIIASNGKSRQKVDLNVRLDDNQVEAPEFDSLEYNINVGDFKTPGILRKFKIRNPHRSKPGQFIYNLSGNLSNMFAVDLIDPDQVWFRKIGCKAMECVNIPDVFPLLLTLYCNDSNILPSKTLFVIRKSVPTKTSHFKQPSFNFTIKENSKKFDKLAWLEIENGNNEDLFFQIEPPSSNFAINQRSGVLTIKTALTQKQFGNETSIKAQLRLIGNQSQVIDEALVRIVIEKSDKMMPPGKSLKFKQQIYAFALSPGQTQIGRVEVEAPMEMIRYRIIEGDVTEIKIDSKSGQLTYIGQQLSQSKNYTLKILAIAADMVDTCSVHILVAGVGSNSPIFPIEFSSLKFNIDANDSDIDAKLKYSLFQVECVDIFGQKARTDCEVNIFVNQDGIVSLNSSINQFSSVLLTVKCVDTRHPAENPAKAQLLLLFERTLKFDSKETVQFDNSTITRLKIPRNLIVDSYIQTVRVGRVKRRFRARQNVTFSLDSESERYFRIEPITGTITTKHPLSNISPRMNLTVIATNLIDSTKNSLNISLEIIDMNRDIPSFATDYLDFYLSDNSPNGEIVGNVRATIGSVNAQMDYKFIEDQITKIFDISRNGTIMLKDKISAKMFGTRQLNLFVSATNMNSQISTMIPVQIHLTQDANEVPNFSQSNYNLMLMENAPVGTFITKFQIIFPSFLDGEKSPLDLKYSLQPIDNKSSKIIQFLNVDQSGVLRTNGMVHKLGGEYRFKIVVNRSERNNSAIVNLKVLSTVNCQPKFIGNQSVLYLTATEINSTVGRFVAETPEHCELEYEIESAHVKIDSLNGNVYAKDIRLLNSQHRRYPLTVKARSGGLLTSFPAELRIGLPKRPSFVDKHLHYQISENAKSDSTIGWIMVENNQNARFKLLDSTDFVINITSGELKTRHSLDREQKSAYNLKVELIDATTSESIDIRNIRIDILDVNDNSPRFEKTDVEVVLDKKSMPGQIVYNLQAIDPDLGGKLIYKIEQQVYYYGNNRANSDAFEIPDLTVGEIILKKSIRDVGGMFELIVTTSDLSDDFAHISRAKISIWICDDSDIGKFVMEQSVRELNSKNITKYLHELETALQVKPILKGVKYHLTKSGPDSNSVLLEVLFINSRTQKIIQFARVEKQLAHIHLNGIKILDYESNLKLDSQHSENNLKQASVNTSSLLIAAVIFCFLLCIVLTIFLLIIYSHRRRFNHHKKLCESMRVLAESSNKHLSDQSSYNLIGKTHVNPMLLQEIEESMAAAYRNRSNLTETR